MKITWETWSKNTKVICMGNLLPPNHLEMMQKATLQGAMSMYTDM